MEAWSWTICHGFVARIWSARTMGSVGVKTCRFATIMGRTSSGECSVVAPVRRGFRSGKARPCSARTCPRIKSRLCWGMLPKAAAFAKPVV
jgi:hypothetical protein